MRFLILFTAIWILPGGQGLAQPDADYDAGSRLQEALKFDTAIICYQRVLARLADNHKAVKILQKRIAECRYGKDFVANPRNFIVVNVGPHINSAKADYAPVLNAQEDFLVFTSRRLEYNVNLQPDPSGKYYEDIYYSAKVDGKWSQSLNMGSSINTLYHDSDLALSADGTQLLLYSELQQGDIMISHLVNGKWSTPAALSSPVNSLSRESSAAFSGDGKQLYVASDRPGGKGGLDIYVFEKTLKGDWGAAKNLGSVVNTIWDEDSPFPDYDGKTLFFSSTGHSSMGGFDIFKTRLEQDHYTLPENLGYPINTPGDDTYFVSTKDGRRAYYSSSRQGGMGEEDIYEIILPPELVRPAIEIKSVKDSAGEQSPFIHLVLYFDTGSAEVGLAEHQRLIEWLAKLTIRQNAVVKIEGHADAEGDKEFNMALSMARAVSVLQLLKDAGIQAFLKTEAWGEDRPVAANDEVKGMALNRRVEITVIQN